MLSTAVPVTHPQPVAPPALAAAAVAEAMQAEADPVPSAHQARWKRRMEAAASDLRPMCSPAVVEALDAFTRARIDENKDDDDHLSAEYIAARDHRLGVAWGALADAPVHSFGDVAAKIALVLEHENGGALLRRDRAEAIVRGEDEADVGLYAGARAYLDCLRLSEADAELVVQGREALRLLAIYGEAEDAESVAWNAWMDGLPRPPAELTPRGIDHALSFIKGFTGRSSIWAPSWVRELAEHLPAMRERAEKYPQGTASGLYDRAKAIVDASAAHNAASHTPEHEAAHQHFLDLQRVAGRASDAAEQVEEVVRAAPAHSVAGLAAKARLLIRSYTRNEGEQGEETWVDQATRTFLEQVIAADEATA